MKSVPEQPSLSDFLTDEEMEQVAEVLVGLFRKSPAEQPAATPVTQSKRRPQRLKPSSIAAWEAHWQAKHAGGGEADR